MDIRIDSDLWIFLAVVLISDYYRFLCGKETHCKTSAGKAGAADDSNAY
jgi:hypothetical protein